MAEVDIRRVEVVLEGISELFFGARIKTPKKDNETSQQHEERCWMERANVDSNGNLFIPPTALGFAIASAGKILRMKIPGEGKSEYTKLFERSIIPDGSIAITDEDGKPVTADDIVAKWMFVPSDGKRGSGKRVDRCFPTLERWFARGAFFVLHPKLSEKVVRAHLVTAGSFIGFGSMRVENGGINGRFRVLEFKMAEAELVA